MQLIYVNGIVIIFSVVSFFFILYTAKMLITFLSLSCLSNSDVHLGSKNLFSNLSPKWLKHN